MDPQTKLQSLSERLNALDTYAAKANPIIRGANSIPEINAARLPGENPSASYDQFLGSTQDYTATRQGLERQSTDLMKMIQDLAEKKVAKSLEERKQALEEAKLGLKYDPHTGSFSDVTGTPSGVKAVAEVLKQGGSDLFLDPTTGKPMDLASKKAVAEDILSSGGVKAYRQIVPPVMSEGKQQILSNVKELLNLDTKPITGAMQIGPYIPGSPAKYTEQVYKQLKGLLSLDNVSKLKGQGQVSDAERRLLEDAASKLDRNLSDEDFKKVLGELQAKLSGETVDTSTSGLDSIDEELIKKYGGK